MFEDKLNSHVISKKSEHAKEKKYINVLKSLNDDQFYNLRSEFLEMISFFRKIVSSFKDEIVRNKEDWKEYDALKLKNYVYSRYFNLFCDNNNAYLKENFEDVLSAIDRAEDYDALIKKIYMMLLEVDKLYSETAKHFLLGKDNFVSQEEKILTGNYQQEEHLFELYQELKKIFNEINDIIPINISFKNFLLNFNKMYESFVDNFGANANEFHEFIEQIMDNCDYAKLTTKQNHFISFRKIIKDEIKSLWIPLYSSRVKRLLERKEYKKWIDELKSKISISVSSKHISDDLQTEFKKAFSTTNYNKILGFLINADQTLECEIKNCSNERKAIIDQKFEETCDRLPYLIFLDDDCKYNLEAMSSDDLDKRFSDMNKVYILFKSITSNIHDFGITDEIKIKKYYEMLVDEVKSLISIIQEISSYGSLESFIEYFEYFEYIEKGREISEQEVFDTIVRHLQMKITE